MLFAVLHPKYKMTYFHNENWEATWIKTAQDMLREEWQKYYKPMIDSSFLEVPTANVSKVCALYLSKDTYTQLFRSLQVVFLLSSIVMVAQVQQMFWTPISTVLLMPRQILFNSGCLALINLGQRLLLVVF